MILSGKLYHCRIRGNALRRFNNYWTNRYQYVNYNNTSSDRKRVSWCFTRWNIGSIVVVIIHKWYLHELSTVIINERSNIMKWLIGNKSIIVVVIVIIVVIIIIIMIIIVTALSQLVTHSPLLTPTPTPKPTPTPIPTPTPLPPVSFVKFVIFLYIPVNWWYVVPLYGWSFFSLQLWQ